LIFRFSPLADAAAIDAADMLYAAALMPGRFSDGA